MFLYLAFVATFFVIIDGYPNFNLRIANGKPESIDKYPFMVSFRSGGIHNCGGSIITKNIILTAGHCTPGKNSKIHVGVNSQFQSGTEHSVEATIRHKDYRLIRWADSITAYNDIALVKVKPAFIFNDTFQPISLFNAGENIESGSTGTAVGWGDVSIDEGEYLSFDDQRLLRSVSIPIIDKDSCLRQLQEKSNYTLYPGEMCAGGQGKSTCQKDSGGPLIVNGRQAGIASWGPTDCGSKTALPAIYTEIAHFREWIDANLKKLTEEGTSFRPQSKPDNHKYIGGKPVWE